MRDADIIEDAPYDKKRTFEEQKSESRINEGFALFGLETSEARAAASFEGLNYVPAACTVNIIEMGTQEA